MPMPGSAVCCHGRVCNAMLLVAGREGVVQGLGGPRGGRPLLLGCRQEGGEGQGTCGCVSGVGGVT